VNRWLDRLRDRPLSRAMWQSIALFAAAVLAAAYWGGDRGSLSFGVGLLIIALAALPMIAVTAVLLLTASREDRLDYVLRIAIVLLLAAAMAAWDYAF